MSRSDHKLLVCYFNSFYNSNIIKREREFYFNYKDVDGWRKFRELTSQGTLSKCFNGGLFEEECRMWFKKLNDILHRCFKKKRFKEVFQQSEVHTLLFTKSKLNELISELKSSSFSEIQLLEKISILQRKIVSLDERIANISAVRNASLIRQNYKDMSESEIFSVPKMWKVKQKLNLKNQDVPTALFDQSGNLVTSRGALLNLYENEYKSRLGPKPSWPGYEDLHLLHEQLFNMHMINAYRQKSDPWTVDS